MVDPPFVRRAEAIVASAGGGSAVVGNLHP
jgi:hypothetical protein